MTQLKLGHILGLANELKKQGMSTTEIVNLPIYLGDDDELNGIHTAWSCDVIDGNDTEDENNKWFVEMINDNYGNIKIKGKAILLS